MSPRTRKNADIPLTWDEWTDKLGQTYRPGDFVAYAIINDRSPQMVFGRVLQIKRLDGNYEPIIQRKFRCYQKNAVGRDVPVYDEVPYCKVKVQPLLDARGFHRGGWGANAGSVRAVMLSIPENIIRIEPRAEWTDEHVVADLTELREELRSQ